MAQRRRHYTPDELRQRVSRDNPFIGRVISQPKRRNQAGCDGDFDVGEQLMADLARITASLLRKVTALRK